jgi:3',5'-cyclic-AMP phosphodiesterase
MAENTETHAATFQGDAMAFDETGILSWLHLGDLHITEQHEENYRDFLALIDHANTHVAGAVNFAVLPGDNAEKGKEDQYRLVRRAVDKLDIPLFVISGDHDVHTGSLGLLRRYLEPNPVRAVTAGEYRLIFLDAVDNAAEVGKPGAFGLRDEQLAWLTRELVAATREKRRALLFNHVYPSELGDSSVAVRTLMRRHGVLMVDMGHTHYNELANDGRCHPLHRPDRGRSGWLFDRQHRSRRGELEVQDARGTAAFCHDHVASRSLAHRRCGAN